MDGKKLSPTWCWPCNISGTPKIDPAETDHQGIQQHLIHTRWQTALHLCTTNYRKTPPTNCLPQCMASPIPGWPTQTLKYSETRTAKLWHNNQIPHCMNNRTTSFWTSRVDLIGSSPLLSLAAQVQPNRPSSLALLQCTLKFNYYYCISRLHQGDTDTLSRWMSSLVNSSWQYGIDQWIGCHQYIYAAK